MADWRSEVADIVWELVYRANKGRAPQTQAEWRNVAERFSLDLHIIDTKTRVYAYLVDNVVVVKSSRSRVLFSRRVAHELAEYLLCSEWEAPYCYRSEADGITERHRVARCVENPIHVKPTIAED